MHIVCSFTSDNFLIYVDEYGLVHYNNYDDHHHVLHYIRGFTVLLMSDYEQLTRL